jgi:eukaryotic-like serine/threonine-protein kinase
LSETPEDAWLIALASAVSDGAAVDWDRLEQQATDSHRRRLLRQMRGVASIVDAHRSDALSQHDTDPAAPAELPPARNWGHIVLFEPIGSGAYATVYRGWDPALDREVAVKIFRMTENTGASPLEEARHLARIRHANVVTVYGADREGDESGI